MVEIRIAAVKTSVCRIASLIDRYDRVYLKSGKASVSA